MKQSQSLLPVFSALNHLGGVSDVELSDSQMDFIKNGCNWTVYQIRNPHPHLFVLHKDGHRILSFSNPESLTNFFKGIIHEERHEEAQTAQTQKA